MRINILVFAYNRLDHLKNLINSLRICDGIGQYEIVFFSDGFKGETDKSAVIAVRNYITDLRRDKELRVCKVVERGEHFGLARSVIEGVTEAFETCDAVIVLEDDLIVGKGFLRYMQGALTYYADDEGIWSVAGFSKALDALEKYDKDFYLLCRASSWGWGTWRNRWDTVDWSVSDYDSFRYSIKKRREFERGGRDMAALPDYQMTGLIDSWAIRWCYEQWKQNKYTVCPRYTLVEHCGNDGSGTHVKKGERFGAQHIVVDEVRDWRFEKLSLDEELQEEFRKSFRMNHIKYIGKMLLRGMGVI